MYENNATRTAPPAAIGGNATTVPAPSRDVLTEILRDGALRLLGQAIEVEVADWIGRHATVVDNAGRRQVVRNGHHPTRTLVTGVGPVAVTQPRVLDRRIVGQNQDSQDVDAADHAGACLGALLTGVVLVPVFGTIVTALLLGAVKLASASLLMVLGHPRRATS